MNKIVSTLQQQVKQGQPIRLEGHGSKAHLGPQTSGSHHITTRDLSGIVTYDPAELYIRVLAGTPLAEIETILAEHNQMLAFEPPCYSALWGQAENRGTIGGLVGANLSGSRRFIAGAVHDHLLGFQAINGVGEIFKSGGTVIKNVTGYDLSKLMCGSFGTLAILTHINLKVLPKPETSMSLCIAEYHTAKILQIMTKALSSSCHVSGAAFHPKAGLMLRLEGTRSSVLDRAFHLEKLLSVKSTVQRIDQATSENAWRDITNATPLASASANQSIWRISCAPQTAQTLLDQLNPALFMLDWGGGLVWMALSKDQPIDRVHALCQDNNSVSLLIRPALDQPCPCPFQPESPAIQSLSARIKAAFDPKGILNPGRQYPYR